MGRFWLREGAETVVERDFRCPEGAKSEGSSRDQFGLVVEALDRTG